MATPGEGNARLRYDPKRELVVLETHLATVTFTTKGWVELMLAARDMQLPGLR